MKPKEYTPHTLRVGRCTDLARQGKPGWYIEKAGRWSSKVWKDTYINLDWTDLALLLNRPQSELQHEIMVKPFLD